MFAAKPGRINIQSYNHRIGGH